MRSAFGIEHIEVAKAFTGQSSRPGDKRNTKYAAAGAGGLIVGHRVGGEIGAATAGTSGRGIRRDVSSPRFQRRIQRMSQGAYDATTGGGGSEFEGMLRSGQAINREVKGVKGVNEYVRGARMGRWGGAAAGVGGYAAYRHHKRATPAGKR